MNVDAEYHPILSKVPLSFWLFQMLTVYKTEGLYLYQMGIPWPLSSCVLY